jgi:transposase
MYRVCLSDAQHQELNRRAHEPGVMPRTRDRLEMVRLSAAGWSIPRIATHLGICEKRVRHWIKAFLQGGFDALPDQPHPGQKSALTPALEEAIRQELRRTAQTWTAQQIADWLATEHGVRLNAEYLAQRLKRARITYKRTGRSLKHKQDADAMADKQAEIEGHEKRGSKGRST